MKRNAVAWVLIFFLANAPFLAFHTRPLETSSQIPAVEWSKTYGTMNDERADSVVQTDDGGFALVGTVKTPSGWGGDFWLVKTDATGNTQWNRTYGNVADEWGYGIIQTDDGGFAIVGTRWNQSRSAADLYLVKTDADGNQIWDLDYIPDSTGGSADWADIRYIIQSSDGNYMLCGNGRHHPLHSTYDWDAWIIKVSPYGQVLWDRPYTSGADDGGSCIIQTGDGGYAFVGATQSWGGSGGKIWLVKIDADGNQQWVQTYGGTGEPTPNAFSVVQTPDRGYAIAGVTYSFGAVGGDFCLIKTDSSGNSVWAKTYGGSNYEVAYGMVQSDDGGFLLAGSTSSFGAGGNDAWLVKTDSSGYMEWNMTFGGISDDGAHWLVTTSDRGYAIAGYTYSYGAGSADAWLIKLAGPSPRTWIVDDDGPADFHTIQEAINAASDGDTVFVRNGTYYEHVIVNKTLSLVGESVESTIIDGSNNGCVIDVLASNVSLSQFTLQNAGSSWPGVYVESSGVSVWNNSMIDNRGGVWVRSGALNVTVSDNMIFNKQPSYADGIRLFSTGTLVVGNTVINESTGIGLDWASNNTIQKNIVINNYIGIGSSTITNNDTIIENTITDNSYGFLIAMYDSIFYHNNVINSTVQAAFYSAYTNSWNNTCEGNYWSDYGGSDENGDGIGDAPYVIDASNRDNYPLMNPYWNLADINHDLRVDLKDIYTVAKSYGTSLTGPNPEGCEWNPHCDINEDGRINMKDYYTVCRNYGKVHQ